MEYATRIASVLDDRVRKILKGETKSTIFKQKTDPRGGGRDRLEDAKNRVRRKLRRAASSGATRSEIHKSSGLDRELRERALESLLSEGEVLRYKRPRIGQNGIPVMTGATVDVFVLDEFADEYEA